MANDVSGMRGMLREDQEGRQGSGNNIRNQDFIAGKEELDGKIQ